jgi:hypothetical protein
VLRGRAIQVEIGLERVKARIRRLEVEVASVREARAD